VGPRAVLDAVVKTKFLVPAGKRTPIVRPVAQRYTTEKLLVFTILRELNSDIQLLCHHRAYMTNPVMR
jgi:hypothetical protein